MPNKKKLLAIIIAVVTIIAAGANILDAPALLTKAIIGLGAILTLVERFGVK